MFVIMNYKIQNFIMTYGILNLIHVHSNSNKRPSKKLKIMKKLKKTCSIHVQLPSF